MFIFSTIKSEVIKQLYNINSRWLPSQHGDVSVIACAKILMHWECPGVRFTKVFRTELGHKYILVGCSVIALCLPVVSKLSRYKLVRYK